MKKLKRKVRAVFGEIIFGGEDALISTLGAVTGIAAGSGSQYVVLLSGIVLLFSEGLSMTAGSYLQIRSEQQAADEDRSASPFSRKNPVKAAGVMGVSYLLGGIFPLAPYFFLPVGPAMAVSILITLAVLFVFGSLKAKFVKVSWWKSGLEMLLVSFSAAVIGFLIGRLVSIIFNVPVEL
jgi:VIT1/CCC1 family predicted Fe2+/Mn2+ transporter